jgi:hypothetical protein
LIFWKVLFVGTQDLCVQSNRTGSNKRIPIRMVSLDGYAKWNAGLDWTQRSCVPTNITFLSNHYSINTIL